jgi:maleate cis-trans isomerase
MKLGLMVPLNNTTMERELLAWMPAGSSCRTLKIPRGVGMLDEANIPAYRAAAVALAREFAGGGYDAIAYGCTAAGFISGPAADAALAAELEDATGTPVVTTAQAMVLALQETGARNIAVVTPYLDLVNDRLIAFLADAGIAVRCLKSFRAANVNELGSIESPEVARLARDTMRDDCDALFIACSQLPTRDIVEPLQREFGRPVWSSIQATAWQAQRALAA